MTAVDDSIRADFLVEAGELVQNLGEQLVALEGRPQDQDLLNAIFRAFHTVKGGAGFLALNPLVELCHAAEDVFNALRAGKRGVDAPLMDAVLQALDQVQAMMQAVANNQALTPAPASLISGLKAMAVSRDSGLETGGSGKAKVQAQAQPMSLDDEFEAVLDQMAAQKKVSAAPAVPLSLEDEFEAVLDQMAAQKKPAAAPVPPPSPQPPAPSASASETTVRVDTGKLDKMMNLVGELVLVRNRLKALRGANGEALGKAIAQLDFITRSLQGAVMQIRMQPVKKVFSRFPKLARDLARGLGKQVEVVLAGEDTDLDKNLVEALADPLVHMVRNSVDHGIEMPDTRAAAGKMPAGKLTLSAQQAGDHILITVRDDGAGMDPERLKAKAVQKGVLDAAAAAQLSNEEAFQLIFAAGFSTKEQISDLSGRGVGMDVVKTAITRLNGSVAIESQLGQGTAFRIRVPLTLAILPALMVQVADRQFAMPLAAVLDVFALDETRVRRLNQWEVLPLKKETLRLVRLHDWIKPAGAVSGETCIKHVVLAQVDEERYGFVVNLVRGREEVVIKPLGARLHGLAGVAGATVTPEGRVALILDFPGLVTAYARSIGSH